MNETIPMLDTAAEDKTPEQIAYTVPRTPKKLRPLPIRLRLTLALGLCVALVLCRIIWPDTAGTLRRWIVGDGSEQVQQAFFSMERSVEEGKGIGEVWSAFRAELTDEPA